MAIEKIYIARHGFRLNWITQTWTSPTGTARDPPLAAYGEAQAEELAIYFRDMPVEERPDAIFSSAFYRCLQTSTPTAKALGLPLFVEHGIGEWFSPVTPGTGLHPRPGPSSSLLPYFPLIETSYKPTWLPSQAGETVQGVHDRTSSFLRAFLTRPELASYKRILFVAHAASVITLAKELAGDRDMAIRVGCCSLTTLVPGPSSARYTADEGANVQVGEWKVVGKTEAGFLKGGIERDWGFEDIEIEKGEVVSDVGVPGTEGMVEGPGDWGLQLTVDAVDSKVARM